MTPIQAKEYGIIDEILMPEELAEKRRMRLFEYGIGFRPARAGSSAVGVLCGPGGPTR